MTFREKIYMLTQKIPKGKVATYGEVARKAGNSKAARAVGMCLRLNPSAAKTPCHRVVASTGRLTGYAFGGVKVKKQLLEKEGVCFVGDRVDLKRSGFRFA